MEYSGARGSVVADGSLEWWRGESLLTAQKFMLKAHFDSSRYRTIAGMKEVYFMLHTGNGERLIRACLR